MVVMWIIRLTNSFENLSSAGTPHGLIDLMTTDHTGENKNSIVTRNNARAYSSRSPFSCAGSGWFLSEVGVATS